jgi:hypothetical protein
VNKNVAAELPAEMVSWLETHASTRTRYNVARDLALDLALEVASVLLTGQVEGEAGETQKVYRLLLQHPSSAVRRLARSASFTQRWNMKTVAVRVAEFFQVSSDWLYTELRRRRLRERVEVEKELGKTQ